MGAALAALAAPPRRHGAPHDSPPPSPRGAAPPRAASPAAPGSPKAAADAAAVVDRELERLPVLGLDLEWQPDAENSSPPSLLQLSTGGWVAGPGGWAGRVGGWLLQGAAAFDSGQRPSTGPVPPAQSTQPTPSRSPAGTQVYCVDLLAPPNPTPNTHQSTNQSTNPSLSPCPCRHPGVLRRPAGAGGAGGRAGGGAAPGAGLGPGVQAGWVAGRSGGLRLGWVGFRPATVLACVGAAVVPRAMPAGGACQPGGARERAPRAPPPSPHPAHPGCGVASDCKKLADHHPAAFSLVRACLDLSALWRSHHIEKSELGCGGAARRVAARVGLQGAAWGAWRVHGFLCGSQVLTAACLASTHIFLPALVCPSLPSLHPWPAAGKRSTAGYKKRAGEISLSVLAKEVLGKPLDKTCQVGGLQLGLLGQAAPAQAAASWVAHLGGAWCQNCSARGRLRGGPAAGSRVLRSSSCSRLPPPRPARCPTGASAR